MSLAEKHLTGLAPDKGPELLRKSFPKKKSLWLLKAQRSKKRLLTTKTLQKYLWSLVRYQTKTALLVGRSFKGHYLLMLERLRH